jgi:sarcosine oxidase
MSNHFDVIVAGVGAMGSSALMQLARRGKRVLGLEKFHLGHQMGSSHGRTRLLRLHYFEGSAYVPMVRRAVEVWNETGKRVGRRLFHPIGAVDIAPEHSGIVQQSLQSCLDHDLRHEVLDATGIGVRFPAFRVDSGMIGLFQPDSGYVESDNAILAHATLASADGATIKVDCPLIDFEPTADGGVRVRTAQGVYTAGSLVLAVGAWIGKVAPQAAPIFRTVRQTIALLNPIDRTHLSADRLPAFTMLEETGHYYGLPINGDHPGVKIGGPHLSRLPIDPDSAERRHVPEQLALIRDFARRRVPDAAGEPLTLGGCIYTWVEDEHFVIDRLPGLPQVILASPCSGHGFKFASVMGEILADLALGEAPAFDLSMFRLDRPALAA